jgi:hypothetical protein
VNVLLTCEWSMPLKRCFLVKDSYRRMAKLYTSEAGVTWPSFSTCNNTAKMSILINFGKRTIIPYSQGLQTTVEGVTSWYISDKGGIAYTICAATEVLSIFNNTILKCTIIRHHKLLKFQVKVQILLQRPRL